MARNGDIFIPHLTEESKKTIARRIAHNLMLRESETPSESNGFDLKTVIIIAVAVVVVVAIIIGITTGVLKVNKKGQIKVKTKKSFSKKSSSKKKK